MKRISVLAVLIMVLALSVAPAAAITNGEPDGEDHPNVGLMIADIDGEPQWRCSGTLIAPDVFLTAGHCTGDGATGARVWFDTDLTDNDEYPNGGATSIEGTPVPHPDYEWGLADPHDVGVVILDKKVKGIEPAALPTADMLDQLKKERLLEGAYFRSVGYGGSLGSWPPPELVYELVRQWSDSEYVALTKVSLHLTQKAVFDESGSCFGDSGGPVFYLDPDGNEIITAVTSSGDGQCVATGINYRVDTSEILSWVQEQIDPKNK